MQIHMTDSTVSVGDTPEGKVMVIRDNKSGIEVLVMLPTNNARKVAMALNGLVLATTMPDDNGRGGN